MRTLKFVYFLWLSALIIVAHALPCAAEAAHESVIDAYVAARAFLPGEPEKAAEIYAQFIAKNNDSPEAGPARVLRAMLFWRNLNDLPAARAELEAAAAVKGSGKLVTETARIARSWLARMKMTDIARACRQYYVQKVQYPENLDRLVDEGLLERADLIDPWGDRFVYSTSPKRLFPDIPHQRYTLSCRHIKGDSTVTQQLLDGERGLLARITVLAVQPPRIMLRLAGEQQTTMIDEGQTRAGLTASLIRPGGAIVTDDNYMVVLTR